MESTSRLHITTSEESCQAQKCTFETNRDKSGSFPCKNFKCKHNFFYEPVVLGSWHDQAWEAHETDVSREYLNCSLELDRALTATEIAAMYGVSHESVGRTVNRAIKSLQRLCGAEVRNNRRPYVRGRSEEDKRTTQRKYYRQWRATHPQEYRTQRKQALGA